MGRTVAATVAQRLMDSGLVSDTAVAIVENAGRPERAMLHCTLGELPKIEQLTDLTGPVMVIIGDAVAGARFENSRPLSDLQKQDAAA